MIFRRLTPSQLILILALLAMLAAYLILNAAYWQMDGQCGSLCGLHMLKSVVMP